jgi:undecaprenyl-diphosphatase
MERATPTGPLRVVVNPDAGASLFGPGALDLLAERLPQAELIAVPEDSSPREVLEAAAPGARALGVAGGDGSVRAAAAVALAHDLPLLVVPAGTLNHFARAVGIPTIDDAIAAADGEEIEVDVCEVDGRAFVNNASLGLYPEVVDRRDHLRPRLGKWLALVVAVGTVLRRSQPLTVEIDGVRRVVWLVFFGNGRYDDEGLIAATRSRLDDGCIDVRIVRADRRLARLRLLVAVIAGRHGRSPVYDEQVSEGPVQVTVLDGAPRLAADGETFDSSAQIEVRKLPRALRVLRPPGDG